MNESERRERIKEFLVFVFTLIAIMVAIVVLSLFFTAKKYYKMGYEEATNDFYYGKQMNNKN